MTRTITIVAVAAALSAGAVFLAPKASAATYERASYECELIAERQTGWHPSYEGTRTAGTRRGPSARGALLGTGAGAATGALIGAASGNAGKGAAIGAGVGLLGGLIGSSVHRQNRADRAAAEREQERRMTDAYWRAHDRCMRASGY